MQRVRKFRGMNQQELANAIGINMQSLSKIERDVNSPTFDTLEKITSALGVTPNKLLSGEWKNTSHMEQEILKFLECEERLNVELAHGQCFTKTKILEDCGIKYEGAFLLEDLHVILAQLS